jgi:hypothetical protein
MKKKDITNMREFDDALLAFSERNEHVPLSILQNLESERHYLPSEFYGPFDNFVFERRPQARGHCPAVRPQK